MWSISKPTPPLRRRNNPRLVALMILSALGALPATAASISTFSPQQQEQIGKIARDYLLAHPEILDQLVQQR